MTSDQTRQLVLERLAAQLKESRALAQRVAVVSRQINLDTERLVGALEHALSDAQAAGRRDGGDPR